MSPHLPRFIPICITAIPVLMAAPVFSAETIIEFNISAQYLADALLEFSQTSGLKLFYSAEMTKNIKSSGLNGKYTAQQGLQKLLNDTGLQYKYTSKETVTIEKAPAALKSNQTNPITLPKVTVVGNTLYDVKDPYNQDYVLPSATAGTKTDTPIMETPLNVQVISKQVLKDQQVINLGDALKNVSGVTLQNYSGGIGTGGTDQSIVLRGFASETYFRNGFRNMHGSGQREMANVESVEVLKGSAAILYGLVEPGGMVNVITKQPLETPYYSVQQQFGSYDLYRTTADATGPLTKDDTLLYRFNFSYEDSGSFRDFVQNKKTFLAPTFKWNISPKAQITTEFEYNHDNLGLDAQFVPTYNRQFINMPISRNYGAPNTGTVDTYFGSLNGSYEFNDNWSIKNSFRANHTTLLRTMLIPLTPVYSNLLGTPDKVGQSLYSYNHARESYSDNIDLTGHFQTWGVKHTLLLGGDYYRDNYYYLDNSNSGGAFNFVDPLNPAQSALPNAGLTIDPTTKYTMNQNSDQYGLYLQDQLELPYQLHFTGGFRYQYLHTKSVANDYLGNATTYAPLTADAVTPRVGLLWNPKKWLSLYSNYAENFGANNGVTFDGKALPPSGSQQWEVGAKTEWFDGRLRATLAYYDLTKQNVATVDPRFPGSGFSMVTGEVRSRGPELDIQGEILPGWNVITNYANTDIIVTKASNDLGNYPTQGSRYFGVPRNTASVWNTYEFQNNDLHGLKIGSGVTIRDGQLASMGYTMNPNTGSNVSPKPFTIPGYATWDLMASYSFKLGKSKLTTQFNVNNLLDKYYFNSAYFIFPPQASSGYDGGYVNFGAPRMFMGSIKLEF